VAETIERAGGERDGTGEFWWIEARQLRCLADELRCVDPLFPRCCDDPLAIGSV
jgi:hypothetical protein